MEQSKQEFNAILEEELEIARRLIDASSLEYITRPVKGYALLKYAILNNLTEIAKLLLTTGSVVTNPFSATVPNITPLHLAVINDDLEIIRMLLEGGANINVPNRDGITPLDYAIKNDKKAITELLLNTKVNNYYIINQFRKGNCQTVEYLLRLAVNGIPLEGSTLGLHVVKGDIQKVKELLESETNVDTKDNNREVLNAAVRCDGEQCGEIVEILLQNGFTVNPEHVNDLQFFQAAVTKGYLKIVEPLLKYGVDVNMQFDSVGLSPLIIAVCNKQEELVKLLISYAADLNAKDEYGKTPIFCAIEYGDLNITRLLLNNSAISKATAELSNIVQSDVDVNATDINGNTPLHYVVKKYRFNYRNFELIGPHEYNPYEEIVKLLLSRGANINAVTKYGLTPFEDAIKSNNIKFVEAILEDVDVNSTFKSEITPLDCSAELGFSLQDEMTPLHCSADLGFTLQDTMTPFHCSAEFGFTLQDEMTPLHCSARHRSVTISKMLLSKGANVNAKLKKNNWTPLHFAVCMNNKSLVEVLLRCGARVDSKIISDLQAYHITIFSDPLANTGSDIFEVLVENGADINSSDEFSGETVLYDVVRLQASIQVTALLKLGADINIESKSHVTPLDLADSQITIVLHRHIAKLKAANLYISRKNLLSFSKNNDMRNFQNACNEEISRMKSEYIANTSASFYNILSRDVSPLARNKNIVQALELNDYKIKFPIYASMIECNFKRGKRRKMLLEGSSAFLGTISNNIPKLPYYNCNEKILSYLSDQDLRNLMVNFKNDDGREELLEQGYRYFHFLFINIPGFSYDCTEKIFSYLSNDDLRNLVEACKPAKLCNSTFPPLKRPNCDLRSITPGMSNSWTSCMDLMHGF